MKKQSKKAKEILHELIYDFNPRVKLVKVCWHDANTNTDSLWMKDVIKQKLLKAETIGYLLYENDEIVVVCGFWFWDGETDILDERGESVFKYIHVIPKSQINTILVLKIDFEESNKIRKNEKTK